MVSLGEPRALLLVIFPFREFMLLCHTRTQSSSFTTPIARVVCALLLATAATLSAQSLNMVSGNGQIVATQSVTNSPMVVQARDAGGHPLANQSITWAITKGQG